MAPSVEGEDDKRQQHLDRADQQASHVVEQRQGLADQAEPQQHGVKRAGALEKDDGGECADEQTGPERQQDQEDQPASCSWRGVGHCVSDGEAEQDADRGGDRSDEDRVADDAEVDRAVP